MTKEIIEDIRKAVLYQHKALTKSVDICKANKFILLQNSVNTRTILVHLKRLEDNFIFKKSSKRSSKKLLPPDIQILQDMLVKPAL